VDLNSISNPLRYKYVAADRNHVDGPELTP